MTRIFLVLGALFSFLGVAAGAFGAHFLKSVLSPDMLAVFETAVRYQMYHAFALLIVGGACEQFPQASLTPAGWLFAIGIVLFSGSLYALAFTGIAELGALTPLGGVGLLAGWGWLARRSWRWGRGWGSGWAGPVPLPGRDALRAG